MDLLSTVKQWMIGKSPAPPAPAAAGPAAGYAMQLDYPPSRDYRPRWGNTRPPHQGLVKLFERDRPGYADILRPMRELTPWFRKISYEPRQDAPSEPFWHGGPITALDLAVLYTFMVKYRPRRYVEIGSGLTTLFAARAKRDHGLGTEIVSIDPQPRTAVDAVCDRVLRHGLETSDLAIFSTLEPGDVVFLDGSHRCFLNSDVTVFFLDVVPQIKPGVVIHLHDIHLPFDYPDMFVSWHWNEQYVLAAHLLGAAERTRVLMPVRYLAGAPEMVEATATMKAEWPGPEYAWILGGSFWFTATAPAPFG
jgi:hypothetical protein